MSGLRCRPGDLAVVVNARLEENIGRLVHVVKAHPERYGYWICNAFSPCRTANSIGVVRKHPVGALVNSKDAWLRPIRPDADEPATETEREKEAA